MNRIYLSNKPFIIFDYDKTAVAHLFTGFDRRVSRPSFSCDIYRRVSALALTSLFLSAFTMAYLLLYGLLMSSLIERLFCSIPLLVRVIPVSD